MGKAKPDNATADDDLHGAYRKICTAFKAWRDCDTACRRAHSCAGDSTACFRRVWPRVGEQSKIWIRTAIKARDDGHSVAEASRMADAEVIRAAEHIARTDAATLARLRAQDDAQPARDA
jgi:hypothetical protein